MRIYIKTPLVNKSKIIPHAVEHCAGFFNKKIEDFFDFSQGLDGEIFTDYTCFEFDRWVKYEDMMKYLFQPIKENSVIYENMILKEELWDPEYAQRIYEKVLKSFLDPKYDINHYKSITLEEVKDYHEKYYKRENAIVVDNENDYKIIFEWFEPEEKQCKELEKRKENFKFRDNKYIVYILNHYNGENYRKAFFCYRMLDYYLYLINRFTNQKYYYQNNYFFQQEDTLFALVEDANYSKLDKKFFEWGKKYLLNVFKYWYYKEKFFLNEYFYWIPKTRDEVIQSYKDFTRNQFKEFLELK